MTHTEIPAIGTPVVIVEGEPYEMTWEDEDETAGLEGVLTHVYGPEWPARFTVTLADGRPVPASRVRVVDDAYRAEQAAQKAVDDRIALRRLALLQEALVKLTEDPAMPEDVRDRLLQIDKDTADQSWREERRSAATGATPSPSWDAGMEPIRARLNRPIG